MQGLGLRLQSEEFQIEARHLITLMVTQSYTIVQALETVPNDILREKLRIFMYTVQLSAAVVALRETGSITRERGNDLLAFLQSLSW